MVPEGPLKGMGRLSVGCGKAVWMVWEAVSRVWEGYLEGV